MALVHAPPAPSASGNPNLDTSWTSAEVWLSMQPENMLQPILKNKIERATAAPGSTRQHQAERKRKHTAPSRGEA